MASAISAVIILIILLLGVLAYRRGLLDRLRLQRFNVLRMRERKPEEERLRDKLARETSRITELEKIRDAKRELMTARARKMGLRKEIDGMTEKTVIREQSSRAKRI